MQTNVQRRRSQVPRLCLQPLQRHSCVSRSQCRGCMHIHLDLSFARAHSTRAQLIYRKNGHGVQYDNDIIQYTWRARNPNSNTYAAAEGSTSAVVLQTLASRTVAIHHITMRNKNASYYNQ